VVATIDLHARGRSSPKKFQKFQKLVLSLDVPILRGTTAALLGHISWNFASAGTKAMLAMLGPMRQHSRCLTGIDLLSNQLARWL
jgi:hypothetical protein